MKKTRALPVVLFLLVVAVVMDTALFMLKKLRGSLYFPGG